MIEFLSRRLAAALVTLVLATVVVFAVVEVLPGDPALVMLGTEARPDTLAALRARHGFDQPLVTRYFQWIGGLLTFDLGASHAYGTSVAKMIGERLQVTLPLGMMALGFFLFWLVKERPRDNPVETMFEGLERLRANMVAAVRRIFVRA